MRLPRRPTQSPASGNTITLNADSRQSIQNMTPISPKRRSVLVPELVSDSTIA